MQSALDAPEHILQKLTVEQGANCLFRAAGVNMDRRGSRGSVTAKG